MNKLKILEEIKAMNIISMTPMGMNVISDSAKFEIIRLVITAFIILTLLNVFLF